MSKTQSPFQPLQIALRKIISKLATSSLGGYVANLPPIARAIRKTARRVVSEQIETPSQRPIPIERSTHGDLQSTLDSIVYDVVEVLGYAVAMVATYEQGDMLSIQALHIDPKIGTHEQIRVWEQQVSQFAPQPVSLSNPEVARTYVYRAEYQHNLSIQAAHQRRPVVSNDLYSLFTPIAPPASQPVVAGIQQALGIQQVIAMPFFLETTMDGQPDKEMVGNLFAAKRSVISEQDRLVLSAFARQAAAAILSERQRLRIRIAQQLVYKIQTSLQDEAQLLQHIVEGVVSDLGYIVSMVASYEADKSLPVRAFSVTPEVATSDQVRAWEKQISRYTPQPISLSNPEIARTYLDRAEYQDNLSVQAAHTRRPVVSSDLYSLFTPIAPPASQPVVAGIQQALGIQQVIAVPFFVETMVDGQPAQELVGNLFAATRSRKFSNGEIELLEVFAQQAAAGLKNARLYRQAEDRRATAQMFGKMAFSASASVHALKNHIGAVRLPLQLIDMAIKNPNVFPEDKQQELLAKLETDSDIFRHLDEAANLLDHLHEPWRQTQDIPTDINRCLTRALNKIVPHRDDWVQTHLADYLPEIYTTPDMLTEAFKVLIKNAVEAIDANGTARQLEITSCLKDSATIEVMVRDNGIGIRREHLGKVFELRWSTKKQSGLGFGLFWAKDYIEGLDGTITVASVPGEGTTFSVSLPVPADQVGI